jgi:hypothetical protein
MCQSKCQTYKTTVSKKKKNSCQKKRQPKWQICIARAQVHVDERSMQRIKQFRVCRNAVTWKLLAEIKNIVIVVVALTNLSPPILANDKFQYFFNT